MNMASVNGIFLDSCQYTPIYFVENPSITQANSYIVTQNTEDVQKPVSDNLKKFYENSGKLETNLCTVESNKKPTILKKPDSNQVGNNLKLASFLLPKPEPNVCGAQMMVPASNVLLKPVYIANTPNIVNNTSKLDIKSKIVQLKEMTNITRTPNGKIVPKTKPKENVSKAKHTSVQLLKLGDSYHSLNSLSEEQMKIVNHALKMFNNPEDVSQQPKYDPVTNTKFIYKVVSSKDVAVVGDNNLIFTQNKPESVVNKNIQLPQKRLESHSKNGFLLTKKIKEPVKQGKLLTQKKIEHVGKNVLLLAQKKQEHIKNGLLHAQKGTNIANKANGLLRQERVELKPQKINVCTQKPENSGKGKSLLSMKASHTTPDAKKMEVKRKIVKEDTFCEANSDVPIFLENAVTRSGRKVRISRYILQDTLDKPKKKVSYVASCPQCLLKFTSTYKLQRHYEFNPTHSPERVHINLFQCFLSIVKGSKANGANVFLDQLEQFISKLRLCIPCLVEDDDGTDQSRFINDDISRLLGISPGKYKIRTNGLDCVKDENGHCKHSLQQKNNEESTWSDPCQEKTKINNEEVLEDVKLPSKRNDIKTEENSNVKKVKLNPTDEASAMITDDLVALLSDSKKTDSLKESNSIVDDKHETNMPKILEHPKPHHIQFRSTHFDIRSSPIKTSTSNFSKFQINTENMSKCKVHILQPFKINQMCNNIDNSNSLPKQLFNDNECKDSQSTKQNINEVIPNSWSNENIDEDLSNNILRRILEDNVIKQSLINIDDVPGPSQLYENNEIIKQDQILGDQDNAIDALNFLESLGNECIYSETEVRNNVIHDFHLDLF
ncbi:uncharacterized protein LOC121728946 [Aricia agestis]|uniref:uncharacterized protein LOC121728946 n=1 Tax=Aricia agestis TaxID=91739 RepID=UPI001C2099A6|nr:uncharacterized protein LOC121728946 [Aricia agestis]